MKVEGYKLNGYDATYRKTLFNVCERGNCVLEITDIESGQTFMLDLESAGGDEHKISAWRNAKTKGHGKSLHFGKAGNTEREKYTRRKYKYNI